MYSLPLLRDKHFFSSNMANGVSKNPSFHTDLENLNLFFVKRAPKKVLAKKLSGQLENVVIPVLAFYLVMPALAFHPVITALAFHPVITALAFLPVILAIAFHPVIPALAFHIVIPVLFFHTVIPALAFHSGIPAPAFACPSFSSNHTCFRFSSLYHRERILKTSTLSCNEEKEEITKPPTK
jgi:hypothetical protein